MDKELSSPVQGEPIAAIATPVGVGALAVVRMSGEGVFTVADKIFTKARSPETSLADSSGYTAHFGTLHDGNRMIDEVIVLVFRSPDSFTVEDMVEITCHGGPVVTQQVLKLLLDNGCRLAEPGEFTRRAFLNGRIDLLQAEAIGEMIHARSESAYRTAVNQMKGGLSEKLGGLREQLLRSCALLELELDFSEEDVEFQDGTFICTRNTEDRFTFQELAERLMRTGGPITASSTSNTGGVGPIIAGNIIDVEVDTDTGKVDVLRCTAFMDAGKAVHPSYVEGQMQGGTVQGIGWALNEEYFYADDGTMNNSRSMSIG